MPRNNFSADLHLHTQASDGVLPPADMVRRAAKAGMDWIAVTDHDTVAGLCEALRAGRETGITVLPGVELSAGGAEEVHLLGYGVDPADPNLTAFLDGLLKERAERMLCMLDRLGALGMDVAPADLGDGPAAFMGRMNLARAMVEKGYVSTVPEAFSRYLRPGKPAYVPRKRVGVCEGIGRLRSFGAVVSLAHPGRLLMDGETLRALLPGWIDAGLSGIEAYHSSHAPADALAFDRLARSLNLLVTGGSDSHGKDGESAAIGAHLGSWRTVKEDACALRRRMLEAHTGR